MSDLTRDQILRAWEVEDKPLPIDVPEWGGTVYAKRLSAAEVTEIGGDEGTIAYRALVRSLVDASGDRLFQDEDVPRLMARPFASLTKLQRAVLDHNGMSAEAAEEAVRDFAGTDTAPNSSVSPSPSESPPAKLESVSARAS